MQMFWHQSEGSQVEVHEYLWTQ